MGTRSFCDQCGNTVNTRLNVVTIKEGAPPYTGLSGGLTGGQAQAAVHQYAAAQAQQTAYMPSPSFELTVELCNSCFPVWTRRVKQLTQASNVQTSQNPTE